jgi:hypothetical protein
MIGVDKIPICGRAKCKQKAPKKGLTGTDIGLDAAAILLEVGAIGFHGLPPPTAIGEAGDAGIVMEDHLQGIAIAQVAL